MVGYTALSRVGRRPGPYMEELPRNESLIYERTAQLDVPPVAGWFCWDRGTLTSALQTCATAIGTVSIRPLRPSLSDERGRGELPRCPLRARGCSLDLFVVLGTSYVV